MLFTIKTNRRPNFQIYSGRKLYMFRTVSLPETSIEFPTRINLEISASVGFYCKEICCDARLIMRLQIRF